MPSPTGGLQERVSDWRTSTGRGVSRPCVAKRCGIGGHQQQSNPDAAKPSIEDCPMGIYGLIERGGEMVESSGDVLSMARPVLLGCRESRSPFSPQFHAARVGIYPDK